MFGLSWGATILVLSSFVPGLGLTLWFFLRMTRLERGRAKAEQRAEKPK